MWIYRVCKGREPKDNGREVIATYTDRERTYLRLIALMKLHETNRFFVERISDKKLPN